MCVFFTGHTVGPTVLKFGMDDHIYPWEVIGYILFGFAAGLGFEADWGFAAGLDFSGGLENAPGEAGYPC